MPPRLAVLTDLPTPYRAPVYDAVTARGAVELHAIYLARGEAHRRAWRVDCSGHPHTHLEGGAWTFRARRGPFAWKWAGGVSRTLDRVAPDAVLVSGWAQPAMHAAVAWARRRGVPHLVTSESHPRRHAVALRRRARNAVAAPLVRSAAAWLPVSSRARALLLELGADPARCFDVPNAPDTRRFARAREDLVARAAVQASLGAGGRPVTLFVGRLIPAKGLDVLIDAARRMKPFPEVWIAGGGPLAGRLARRARRAGLERALHWLGEQPYDRVVALHAAADLVVLPSVHEPYGVALHEGMAAGAAALASDAVGAAHDLVEDGVCGRIVPSGEAGALASAWSELLESPARLAGMGRAAQARALARGIEFAAVGLEQGTLAALGAHAGPAPSLPAPALAART